MTSKLPLWCALGLLILPACQPPHQTSPMTTQPHPVAPTEIALSGRLLYRDGTAAVGVPYELEVAGDTRVGLTDHDGRLDVAGIVGPVHSANLQTLDGFVLSLTAEGEPEGMAVLSVPVTSGALSPAYLLAAPQSMVLVMVPPAASSPVREAIIGLDMVGSHGEGQLLTTLSPQRLAELRATGVDAFVLHPDANAYAAESSDMTDAERAKSIDDRLAAAQVQLARLRTGG